MANLATNGFQPETTLCRDKLRAEMARADDHPVSGDRSVVFRQNAPCSVQTPKIVDLAMEQRGYQRVVRQFLAKVCGFEPATAGEPEPAGFRGHACQGAGLFPGHRVKDTPGVVVPLEKPPLPVRFLGIVGQL